MTTDCLDKELYIGLMSGTSCDAIDAVLVEFTAATTTLIATHVQTIPTHIKQKVLAFNTLEANEIQHYGELDTYLGEAFAETCLQLLQKTHIPAEHIRAIGSHGQNIRHQPNGQYPFTLQIGDPNIIACRTGITTIADFRRRDLALGGQGAPLAPAFHAFLLQDQNIRRWVLNIGGIANLTWLPTKHEQHKIIGFDTGPGNCLLDQWCKQYLTKDYDHNGAWAKQGLVNENLLDLLLADDYFRRPSPKSTGREHFNLTWLMQKAAAVLAELPPQDVQATLLELTIMSIMQAIHQHSMPAEELWVCGGGSRNHQLMQRLAESCQPLTLHTTDACGMPTEWLEASAFAWLAQQTLRGKPGNLASVTGARSSSVLGAIYPGNKFSQKDHATQAH